jgi:hypothetical protein
MTSYMEENLITWNPKGYRKWLYRRENESVQRR